MKLRQVVWSCVFVLMSSCRDAAQPSGDPGTAATTARDPRIPPGSGDYSSVLADVEQYRGGKIAYTELEKRTVARKLPPHSLGCAYLMTPVPMPPPGVEFNQWMMPTDWEHTFGEVAMVFWVGRLDRADLDRLHTAAHPSEPPLPK